MVGAILLAVYAAKICDMRILLKYAKNTAVSEICGNRIKLTCLDSGKCANEHHPLFD